MRRSLVAFLCVCLSPLIVLSQESRSTISGAVFDPNGAVMPGVKVLAIETRTNTKVETASDSSGAYVIPFLAPGEYDLTVQVPGFKRYQHSHLVLNSGDHPVIDIRLALGDVTQSVTVNADVPLLATADATNGLSVTARQVESLPLNGRTPLNLTLVTTGVMTTTAAMTGMHAYDNSAVASFSIAGMDRKTSELLIDGAPDNASDNAPAYSPPQDAVEEVKVHTFASDAAYGHTGAGVANQITKSGTNAFHGSAWEFNQNSFLAANAWFNDKNGVTKPVSRQNQWGMSAGAPIYIPKLINGKDKIFWFFAYEGIKNIGSGYAYTTVPTAAERTGDFSALLAAGPSYQIYNPLSATADAAGNVTRSPFPNNVIPQSAINAIGKAYMQFYPSPNATTVRNNGVNDGYFNFYGGIPNNDNYNNEFGRLDFNIGISDRVFFSFRHNDRMQHFNDFFSNAATGDMLNRMNWGSTVDYVHTFSPSTIANLRLNFTRFVQNQNLAGAGFNSATLGYPGYLSASSEYLLFPRVTFGGGCSTTGYTTTFQCLGYSNNTPSLAPFNSYGIFADVVKTKGTHTLKLGVDARDFRKSSYVIANSQGTFGFDNTWTKATTTTSTVQPLGGDLAALLLGLPSSGSYDVNSQYTAQNSYLGVFFQDDWRVRSNLTLNFGIRFDRDFPGTESHNRAANGFDVTSASPVSAAAIAAYALSPNPLLAASQFKVNGGLTFANSNNSHIYESQSYNFSPRFGYAWTPAALKGKTVLRGGFGVFVLPVIPWNSALNQEGFSQTTQMVTTNNNFLSPAATLSNPFPNGILAPSGSSKGLATFLGQNITFFNPDYQNGYSERWHFGVQHQLPGAFLVEADYVGNHAVRLSINRNLNWIQRQYQTTASNPSLSSSVNNPFAGLLPGTNLNGSKISLAQLLSVYPQFPLNGITEQNTQGGASSFHALDLKIEKRPGHGITLLGNYQWSKQIERMSYLNDSDLAPEKRVSSLDHTHHLVAAVTYELPFGRGRTFNFGNSRALDLVAGGWTWNTIYTYQTGAPLTWGNVIYLGGPLNLKPRTVDGVAFNTAAFDRVSADQPVNNLRVFNSQFGNLRADAINNWDSSLMKNFHFTEGKYLQLRLEAFNAWNHPQFGTPNLTPTSSAFGTITGTANGARVVQIGARVAW